ncbi:MFS transporter [Nocardioides eburneiflavus]|uniref:MFS transporter n=2 Tax=Nocardioides eburneiflavus TaxID=2518372 RepID=A0A4Z1BXM1_9ACTN|nr:MFS transporter [Nocardioides eburneiflavus]
MVPMSAEGPPGTFAALRRRLFALLLTVQLVNATAVWSHVVTVQWMLTERGESATVVSLAPAAMALPFLLLALPVGAVVGFASRERLQAVAMLASAVSAVVGALLGVAGIDDAALLVGTVLVVGAALAVVGVAWQSLITELVGRPMLGSATVLDGAVYNVARAVGPLVAGIGLGLAGSTSTFLVVAGAFTACGSVFLVVETRRPGRREPRRAILPDIVQALRFAQYSPWTRRLLARMVLFGLPASALWALVSLVAHDRLGLDSRGFGVVMALLGSGAVVATFVLPPLRRRLPVPVFAAAGSSAYALTMLVLGTSTSPVLVGGALVLGGVAWVGVQSTWMMLAHQAMPDWVRPRIIALLLFLFQGTQAVGALLWGFVADLAGLPGALLAATMLMVLSVLVLLRAGLGSSVGIEPDLADVDAVLHGRLAAAGDGELEVRYEYAVPHPLRDAFGEAMGRLRMSRLRLGARDWLLAPHPDEPDVFVETYRVLSRHDLVEQESVRLTVPEARLRTAVRAAATEVCGPLMSSAPARDPRRRADRGRTRRGSPR